MKQNIISGKNAICILCLIVTGSNFIFKMLPENQNDQWISITIAFLISIPVMMIYGRIITLCKGKSLFAHTELLFGPILSRILSLLLALFAVHSVSRSLVEFSETLGLSVLRNTPVNAISIMIIAVCLFLSKSNLSVLGKMSLIILIIGYIINIFLCIFSLPFIKFENLFPIADQPISGIFKGAFNFASLSTFELFFILGILETFSKGKNNKKIFLFSLVLSYIIIIGVFFRTVLLLGAESFSIFYFPRYIALRLISTNGFFERIENFSYYSLLLAGIIKISLVLVFAAKAISFIFSIKNYRDIIPSITFFSFSISNILVNNVMEMFSFLNFYSFYSVPFQIIVPIIIWVFSEIKIKKINKTNLLA